MQETTNKQKRISLKTLHEMLDGMSVELYCHLRQMPDLSKRMADEMDINLEVFNLETDFFGDLHCSSRFTDILCDAQAQYQDYSELEKCPMWGMWEKEGGEV